MDMVLDLLISLTLRDPILSLAVRESSRDQLTRGPLPPIRRPVRPCWTLRADSFSGAAASTSADSRPSVRVHLPHLSLVVRYLNGLPVSEHFAHLTFRLAFPSSQSRA